jgi:glucose/arabinose dehydrogenase
MCDNHDSQRKLYITNIGSEGSLRYLDPGSINLQAGYRIEVFATGFDAPSCIDFTDDGNLLVAESGFITEKPRILCLQDGAFKVVAEGFRTPISGMTFYNDSIYIAHRGSISRVLMDGTIRDILSGLPSNGDFGNSNVKIGPDGKMYFGQGTVTNSGVVGTDNRWVPDRPFLYDRPGTYIMLNGQNFSSTNIMSEGKELAYSGAFSPFGEPNEPHEIRKGVVNASGSILKANLDGTGLEMVSWGLRYPSHVGFDHSNRLFVANIGYDNRGSRPIVNAPDEFHLVVPGTWYGWPDYAGGEPLTNSRFRPEGGRPLEFLLTNHPNLPPRPYAAFPTDSNVMGFDFNYSSFGSYGHAYIAEFGRASFMTDGEATPYSGFGYRISEIDMSNGGVSTFAINKSGFSASLTNEGGFGRPIDVRFGPDNAMYLVDLGINAVDNPNLYYPKTGVIWRVTRI